MKMFRKNEGFTLVELMVVVLIIGILVAIAVPVFLNASANAQAKSCQANQRTIVGAIQTFNASLQSGQTEITTVTVATEPVLDGTSATGNLNQLVSATGSIKTAPVCPETKAFYKVGDTLWVIGDQGTTTGFKTASHQLGS